MKHPPEHQAAPHTAANHEPTEHAPTDHIGLRPDCPPRHRAESPNAEVAAPAPNPGAASPEEEHPAPKPGIWVVDTPGGWTGSWYDATGTAERVAARIGGGRIYNSTDFGSFEITPDEDPAVVAAVANGIREHGYGFAAWADFHDAEPALLDQFAAHYVGEFRDLAALGRDMYPGIEERLQQTLPEDIRPYVTVAFGEFAKDMADAMGLLILDEPEGGIYVFRGPEGTGSLGQRPTAPSDEAAP
jgi:Antirestriction protein (ArdA)